MGLLIREVDCTCYLSAITKECEALGWQIQTILSLGKNTSWNAKSVWIRCWRNKSCCLEGNHKHYSATAQRAILIQGILSFMDRLMHWLFKSFVVFGIVFRDMIKLEILVIRKLVQDWVQLRVFLSTEISLNEAAAFLINNRSSRHYLVTNSRIYWNPEVHYCVYKSPPFVDILIQSSHISHLNSLWDILIFSSYLYFDLPSLY